tara:strand:- start:171 stop:635 length:465 start_codon:yes stop_codon:yes gene_type:complete
MAYSLFGDWRFKNPFAGPTMPNPKDFYSTQSYGDFGASTMQDAMRFRGQGDSRFGSQPGMPAPNTAFDESSFSAAQAQYNYDAAIHNEKMKQQEVLFAMAQGVPQTTPSISGSTVGGDYAGPKFSVVDPVTTFDDEQLLAATYPFLDKRKTKVG